jgi:hypothetical protein
VTLQRAIAAVMILGSSLLIVWVSDDIAFPAILSMLGMVGVLGRFKWDLRPERHYVTALLLLLLAVLFSIHCEYAHPGGERMASFAWQTIARYFLASMILILFLRSRRPAGDMESGATPLSPSLGLFHLGSALASGQVLLLDDRYIAFRLVELASGTLAVLYAICSGYLVRGRLPAIRRLRLTGGVLCVVLLIAAVNLGWIGGSLMYGHIQSISLLPNWLSRSNVPVDSAVVGVSRIGFTTSGRLSNLLAIKDVADTEPVLKITSDACPGYLRGMAFLSYRQSEWMDATYGEDIRPEQTRLFGRTNLFRLSDRQPNREMTIRHENVVIDAMFTPLGVCSVEAPFGTLQRDGDDGTIKPSDSRNNLTYHVTYTTSLNGNPPSADQISRMLKLPLQLDPGVRQLASRVFRGCRTTAQKIDAVTRYFQTNYTYSLGVNTPIDQDSLTYFLLKGSSGYCEYFASGTAILLRLVQVPTRYVTGFLVTERGETENSWVARNMDAHAWVEAWDQERNTWEIVEATAQEDLADDSLLSPSLESKGGGRTLLGQLVQAVYDYGLLGVLGWFFEVYSLRTAMTASLAFSVAAVSLALWRRYLRLRRVRGARAARSPQVLALHRVLALVDRKAKSTGSRRLPQETLHAFADRIRRLSQTSRPPLAASRDDQRSFADWYLQYASLRYCGTITPERLDDLHQSARKL